ncbi:tetratricopeptide repeat protein [Flavobacterium alkalisoli]|uniref:Tetratricopeptide repeat protein n=1 Tax=Flavobacterium alkalisoli TaxID=2602769 RepID=A0A5B9FSR4_9FLAO|nr:tetratricopeptide repeat protein [Flavobacterium alkalisoli]QEE50363.1 tetratricopeptide repeat protein [Flavobacterium alkalisoli]
MKAKYAIAASLLISIGAYAQKDELKQMKKIVNKEQPTAEDLQKLKQLIDQAEPLMANADDKQKADFYYYKGNYDLVMAIAKMDQNGIKAAIADFNKVLELEKTTKREYTKEITEEIYPEVSKGMLAIAKELGANQNYKAAVPLYEMAYELNKKDTINLYNAAAYAINAKDYDASLKYFEELDRLGFTNKRLSYTATSPEGEVQYFNDKKTRDLYIQTASYTNPGVHKDPSVRGDIIKNIALLYIQKGDKDKAMQAIAKAKKQNPNDIGLLSAESQIYFESGDMENYQRVIKDILNLGSKDPNLYFNLGVTSAQAGQKEEAKQYYQKAIEIDPKYAAAYYNIGVLLLDGEDAIVSEMNGLGTSKKDMARYDLLKEKRDAIYKESLSYVKKAYDMETNPENKEQFKALLASLYTGLDMMDEANALKKK